MTRTAPLIFGLLVVGFAFVNGALMSVSPKHFEAFLRWYTCSEQLASQVKKGAQTQIRLAGVLIAGVSLLFAYLTIRKLMDSPSATSGSGSIVSMSACGLLSACARKETKPYAERKNTTGLYL